MANMKLNKAKWYQAGLAFTCHQCGDCCSGPGEGYVWVTRKDIASIAAHLNISLDDMMEQYVRRVGMRFSLIEKKPGNDCIFLQRSSNGIRCEIYPVRPVQCRTWPFWPEVIKSPDTWNQAATHCQGMNKGRLYSVSEIETVKMGKAETGPSASDKGEPPNAHEKAWQWLRTHANSQKCLRAVKAVYDKLDKQLDTAGGICQNSGNCCRFEKFGHRLYVTTLEMLYFLHGLNQLGDVSPERKRQSFQDGTCPYQVDNLCTVRTFRPAGCRIFYCQGFPEEKQKNLTEIVLEQLRQLHEKLNVPYYYDDWLNWLKSLKS